MIRGKSVAYACAAKSAFQLALYQDFADSFFMFGILIQPIIIAVLGLWILGDKSAEFRLFVAIGSGTIGLWSRLLFINGNSIAWQHRTWTIEVIQ